MGLEDYYSEDTGRHQADELGFDLRFSQETGSTNDELKALTKVCTLMRPSALCVLRQFAGRGTRGRGWTMKDGDFIFSLALSAMSVQPSVSLLPLAVGTGVCRALTEAGIPVSLKWPNDLWFKGGKTGGILCEMSKGQNGHVVVIGVGINLFPSDMKTTNGWRVSGLSESGAPLSEPAFRTRILTNMIGSILSELQKDSEAVIDGWHSFDAFIAQAVRFSAEAETLEGIARGIDKTGRFMLETKEGMQSFLTGSIVCS